MNGEPRPLSEREISWLRFLLPADRPGYDRLYERAVRLQVLGVGRWGEGDLVLGEPGRVIDDTAGMSPVAAYGEIAAVLPDGAAATITLAVHQPDEGMIELHIATLDGAAIPADYRERSRWSYSHWLPGSPCPATGAPVREVGLDDAGGLRLAISPARRVLWLYDPLPMTSTLVPVTNFYNELMLLNGVRDPLVALDHGRLFSALAEFSDIDLRSAFTRYNMSFRKIDPERLTAASPAPVRGDRSLLERMGDLLRRRR